MSFWRSFSLQKELYLLEWQKENRVENNETISRICYLCYLKYSNSLYSISMFQDVVTVSGRPVSMQYFVGMQQFQPPTSVRVEICQIQCQTATVGPLQTI